MPHLTGIDRTAKLELSLEELIEADNPVRMLDAFVESLDLAALGFAKVKPAQEGRPAYPPQAMLKRYLYGYFNRIRSSRKLALECGRNLEVRWLLAGLRPAYHCMADFRKIHALPLVSVFKTFTGFLKQAQMLGGEVLAIDGTKIRAVNSKKNNYNQLKITRHLAYIDRKVQQYQQQLAATPPEQVARVAQLQQQLETLEKRQVKYAGLQQQVTDSEDGQVSTTDPQSRALIIHRNIVEVAYNVQSAVDAKHKLILHCQATNRNDAKALHPVATAAKAILGLEQLTVLADKGYHNGEQLRSCQRENITTLVAYREFFERAAGSTPKYYQDQFSYDQEKDPYTCPQGHPLTTNGHWYQKQHRLGHYLIKRYRTPACLSCPVKALCTQRKYGRNIDRSEYQEAVEANNQRVDQQKALYKQRQALCEHPFGTIKRAWGYSYTLLKGLKKVNGEMALIFLCYNLRRSLSILGLAPFINELKKAKMATILACWRKINPSNRLLSDAQSESRDSSWIRMAASMSLQWPQKENILLYWAVG